MRFVTYWCSVSNSFLAFLSDCSAVLTNFILSFLTTFNRFSSVSCFKNSVLAALSKVCCLLNSACADFKTFSLASFCFVKSTRRFLDLSSSFLSLSKVVLAMVRLLLKDDIFPFTMVSSFLCFLLKLSRASLALV